MKVPIPLPELGIEPVVFSHWYAKLGERVAKGERVAEVIGPSTTFDVPAALDGVLIEQCTQPNDDLATGQMLGIIDTSLADDEM